jgi:23S rRNA (uracil1939-C5)-methyltransferase
LRKKNKRIELEQVLITSYAAEGKCIARVDNKVIFVAGAVPGDVVNLLLTKNKADWAEAIVTKIVTLSPDRVAPTCIHFGTCGGCKWQMLPYALQMQFKQQQVQDVLQRIGGVREAIYLPLKGSEKTFNYRNKLEFTFSNKKYLTAAEVGNAEATNMQNVVGYHAPRLFDKVIDITECHLMEEPQNKIRNGIRDFALANNYSFYDIRSNEGLLRNMMLRTTTTAQTLVNIMFGANDAVAIENVMQFVKSSFPEITSLHYTINLKKNDTIYDQNIITYHGPGFVSENLNEFKFKISPKSFFQTNTAQAVELYTIARDFANLKAGDVLYDLYCGTGSIGIFCSTHASKIIGVDSVADAIEDAKINAANNNLQNTHFYAGDVIDICNNHFFEEHGMPDVIICDPPRAGMHNKLIQKLLEIKAPRIVYVSCNPATQARDLQELQTLYKVIKVQAVDMFPHTHHVESVVLLELNT